MNFSTVANHLLRVGLVLLLLRGTLSVGQGTGESVADQRLEEILIAQQELLVAAEEGLSDDGLMVRAQDLARSYESFLADNPDHFYGWLLCGRYLRSIGADSKALAALRKADSLQPNNAVVQRQIGQTLSDQGLYEPALPFLLEAVELDGDEPTYHEDLGVFLVRFGPNLERDEVLGPGRAAALALESFENAFRLDPENFERGWHWAEAHADLPDPDWEAAALAWQRVIGLADSLIEQEASRLRISRAWIEAGAPEKATQWMDPVETAALEDSWRQLQRQMEQNLRLSDDDKMVGQDHE